MRTARAVPTPLECKKTMIWRDGFLLRPGGDDGLLSLGANALEVGEPLRVPLDDVKGLLTKGAH
jgi:hypothetical protein